MRFGIKNYERELVLKYHSCIHKYIEDEKDFLNISFSVAYQYVVKIKYKCK